MTVITATCERCAGRYGPDYMDGDVCVYCAAKLEREALVLKARAAIETARAALGPYYGWPTGAVLKALTEAVEKLIEAAELPEPGGGR